MAKLRQIFTESAADDILIIDKNTLKNIHCIVIYIYRENDGGETMPKKIYIGDDEKNIRDLIAVFLEKEGFETRTFANGDDLMKACSEEMPDLVILDIMMPGTDGLSVCSMLRQSSDDLPIIIVSAKDTPYDRVTGLTLGSDDYMVKPFLPLELVARVKALLRRSGRSSENSLESDKNKNEISFAALRIFPELRTASIDGKELNLTPTEFDFLRYMTEHQERAVSREELLKNLWQMNWQADTRATDDLVKRLRKKLRENHSSVRIETVWGFGFRLVDDAATAGR